MKQKKKEIKNNQMTILMLINNILSVYIISLISFLDLNIIHIITLFIYKIENSYII